MSLAKTLFQATGPAGDYALASTHPENRSLRNPLSARLYGPLQPWFDRIWMRGDLELVK